MATRSEFIKDVVSLLNKMKACEDDYKSLRSVVVVDREAIDEELIRQPALVLEVNEMLVEVSYLRSLINKKATRLEALIKAVIVERKKLEDGRTTKDVILDEVQSDLGVIKVNDILLEADRIVGRWGALRAAITEKSSDIRHLSSQMTGGQYPNVGVTSGSVSGSHDRHRHVSSKLNSRVR